MHNRTSLIDKRTCYFRMLRQEAEEMAAEEKRLQLLISREEEQAALQQKAREKVIMELVSPFSFWPKWGN